MRVTKHPGDAALAALVAAGRTNAEIAEETGLSVNSVKRYLARAGIRRQPGRAGWSTKAKAYTITEHRDPTPPRVGGCARARPAARF